MLKYPYIKKVDYEAVLQLSEQVSILPGQIVSKTLAQNEAVSLTLFAFDKGEEIGTHDSEGDALVTVLEGTGEFTVEDKKYFVKAGESLVMPAKKPHAVFAPERFKMCLLVVFPYPSAEKERT